MPGNGCGLHFNKISNYQLKMFLKSVGLYIHLAGLCGRKFHRFLRTNM